MEDRDRPSAWSGDPAEQPEGTHESIADVPLPVGALLMGYVGMIASALFFADLCSRLAGVDRMRSGGFVVGLFYVLAGLQVPIIAWRLLRSVGWLALLPNGMPTRLLLCGIGTLLICFSVGWLR